MTARFAFVGDPHFGKLTSILGAEKGLALQCQVFRQVVDVAIKKDIHYLVIVGDIFCTPYPNREEMITAMDCLADRRVRFLVYRGNHDVADAHTNSLRLLRRIPRTGGLRNVTFVDQQETLEWGGVRVHVMPWAKKYRPVDDDADIVFFHDDVVGAKRDNGTPLSKGFDPSWFKGIPAVSGHLHTPQTVGGIRYCGTPAQMSFGEKPEKRLLFAEYSDEWRFFSRQFEAPWSLITCEWDSRRPPSCDAPDTYYRLLIKTESPPPRWLAEHPQVVKTEGKSVPGQKALTDKVIRLVAGKGSERGSDRDVLDQWLRAHSGLDRLSRARALKVDERL